MLWASVGNTLPATFWATYYLVSHPEALQAVRQEILDVLRDDGVEFSTDNDVNLSKEQLDKLIYLGITKQHIYPNFDLTSTLFLNSRFEVLQTRVEIACSLVLFHIILNPDLFSVSLITESVSAFFYRQNLRSCPS